MTFVPVTRLAVLWEPVEGERVPVGRLGRRRHELFFEYDPQFLRTGLELSPFRLPARPGVFAGNAARFEGLMGLFDDSLPDGWGRLLLDRRARQLGLAASQLSPLDRLSLVGSMAMGALVYEPEQVKEVPTVIQLAALKQEIARVVSDDESGDLERLFAIGGSPHGARPKALVQLDARGRLHAGVTRALPGCEPWMLKFRARDDAPDTGALEHAYFLMARAAGLDVPETRLLGRSPGVFAIRRFDRDGRRKTHLHTLAGLLEAPHTMPSVTYTELLLAARRLVGSEAAVLELFRRACFNVLAHNRDDHSKNFAFLMDPQGRWSVSPAYDLNLSAGPGGEHWMLIAGEGRAPTREHLLRLARETDVRRPGPIIDEVRAAVSRFARFAREAGLSQKTLAQTARVLGVRPR